MAHVLEVAQCSANLVEGLLLLVGLRLDLIPVFICSHLPAQNFGRALKGGHQCCTIWYDSGLALPVILSALIADNVTEPTAPHGVTKHMRGFCERGRNAPARFSPIL